MCEKVYSIQEMRTEFGVTARCLRFYEDKGLLNPIRKRQRRFYTNACKKKLRLILRGKYFRFSLNEIKDLLDLYNLNDNRITQINQAIELGKQKHDQLREEREEIDSLLLELAEEIEVLQDKLQTRTDLGAGGG